MIFMYLLITLIIIAWANLLISLISKRKLLGLKIGISVILFIVCESPIFAYFLNGDTGRFFRIIGNYFIGIVLYFALVSLVIYFVYFLVTKIRKKKFFAKGFVFATGLVLFFTLVISLYGFINVDNTYYAKYEVDNSKSTQVEIALLSDIHLGYNTSTKSIQKMVKEINDLKADVVLFAGDIFENDYYAVKDIEEVASIFTSIKSTFGVYGVYGNHDFADKLISGFAVGNKRELNEEDTKMAEFFSKANITMLNDESVLLNNSFYLIGRNDLKRSKTIGVDRKSITDLTSILNNSLPKIILDHEPEEYNEFDDSLNNNIKLVLSGHTHGGQLFPANLVTKIQYTNDYGQNSYKGITFITTQGYGTWGPRMRVGTRTEIAVISLGI